MLLLTRYSRAGPSSRLRFLQYLPGLRAHGIEVEVAPFFHHDYLERRYAGHAPSPARLIGCYWRRIRDLARAPGFDVVWVEKEALPWMPAAAELSALCRSPLIVDFDDAWHLRYRDASSRIVRLALRRKLEAIARRADAVVVGNAFLQRWAEEAGAAKVTRIPTVLDLSRYSAGPPPSGSPFTIGWIGTPETIRYLDGIRGALTRLLDGGGTRLLLIGVRRFCLAGPHVETQAWSETAEDRLLQRIHVGVMPLRDGAWEHGKSACKLLQYMAAGRPVVASPVGTARTVVRSGVNGVFATTDGEWVTAIESLRADPAAAAAMGSSARRTVEASYSLELTLPKIADVLLAAAGARQRRARATSAWPGSSWPAADTCQLPGGDAGL